MLVRATLILIALFVGGWMVFEGTHVLIYGRFSDQKNPARGWAFSLSRERAIN